MDRGNFIFKAKRSNVFALPDRDNKDNITLRNFAQLHINPHGLNSHKS